MQNTILKPMIYMKSTRLKLLNNMNLIIGISVLERKEKDKHDSKKIVFKKWN